MCTRNISQIKNQKLGAKKKDLKYQLHTRFHASRLSTVNHILPPIVP